jgi:hypothetical protein
MQPSRLDELIRAERAALPEAGADARIWTALEHRLTHGPPPPEGVEAGVGAAGGAAGKATLIIKVAAGVALIAAGVAGIASRGGAERPVREDMPVVAAAEPARAPEVAPKTEAPEEPVSEVAPAVAPIVAAPEVAPVEPAAKKSAAPKKKVAKASEPEETKVAPPAEPVDFTAELALIGKIRRELQLGAWTGALALVDEHTRKFGARGQLVQERMAYHVLALCALERVDDARRIGGELVTKWPDSTHLPRLQSSCAFK